MNESDQRTEQRPPRVYHRRMVLFVIGLEIFLASVMFIFYQSNKSLLLSESDSHLDRLADLVTSQLTALEQELYRRVEMISSNVMLQEYMFVVAELEGEPASFRRIYQKQVASLAKERSIVLTAEGEPIVGSEHKDLIHFNTRVLPAVPSSQPMITYYYSDRGLELMARGGIFHKGRPMGQVAVAHSLDKKFFHMLKLSSGGDPFLVSDGKILQSTPLQSFHMAEFVINEDLVRLNNMPYKVRQIPLKVTQEGNVPELWLGVNQQRLFDFLNNFLLVSVTITFIGAAAILVFGMYLVRRIIKPIQTLVDLTQDVARGRLPDVKEVVIYDEMDYLTSGFYSMVTGLKKKQERINEANRQLQLQSVTDPLTGLFNRRYFNDITPKLNSLYIRERRPFQFLMIDIDYFKQVNDIYGHACGDEVLVSLSHKLRSFTRESDFCFRIGGEEFLVLISVDNLKKATIFANKLRCLLEKTPVFCGEQSIRYTVSIGVVQATEGLTTDDLLRLADQALYNAKEQGRNRVCAETL